MTAELPAPAVLTMAAEIQRLNRALRRAQKLLAAAQAGLRFEATAMTDDEIHNQPYVRRHLRLADRIERFLEVQRLVEREAAAARERRRTYRAG